MTFKALLPALAALSAFCAFAQEAKRDPAVVRDYIVREVGKQALDAIKKKEGGAAFLKRFFADREWMEEFAGSGPWSTNPWRKDGEEDGKAAKALEALDLLVWNDEDDFITTTKIGRNAATALALNHGNDFNDRKLVSIMECYREWAANGTLDDSAYKLDTRQWREVMTFGQNAELPVENLRWIHDFANLPSPRYGGVCWTCHYRLFNCFGASVHGPDYYAPWAHRWNTQELRYRVGGVCGALSKFGSHCAASHGVRSFTAGQPGHCAYVLWDEKSSRWGISYAVTGHTNPHFSLGGQGFAALEEQERYFSNPKRMTAEYFRWKGEYEKSMKVCPANWQAAYEWRRQLASKNAPAADWAAYGAAVLQCFKDNPAQGWQLYMPYLKALKGRSERIEAAKKGLLAMRENPAPTAEPGYWDEIALKPLDSLFQKDDEAMWQLLPSMLEGQAKTAHFSRQTVNWAAGRLMTGAEGTKKFLAVIGSNAKKLGLDLDGKGMVLTASKSEDVAMFRQVYSLVAQIAPDSLPKANGKSWPKEMYGGQLLSPDGLLKTSSTSGWENPTCYRYALTAEGFSAGNAFHTDKEESPWGMVVLPGSSDISGITVVNAGGSQNGGRQVPLVVSLSDDGVAFEDVYTSNSVQDEWQVKLPSPKKAKYIKVGRKPGAKADVFHLYKILVYGKKLY